MKGVVTNKVQGFYYVQSEGRLYECRLRGILKRSEKRDNCVVGDIVEFSPEGTIDAIEERRNFLGRPLVANIDYILIQFAVKNPDLDFEKLNILLLNSFYYGISPIILINKIDLLSKNELQTIQKKLQFLEDLKIQVFYISRDWNIGIEDVRQYIKGATSAFGGPSGVGKSSVVNVLQSHVHMETGETSRKLTGRHTTKETRLIPFDVNGFIIDTPGFSSVDIPDIENSDVLISLFPEFLRTEQSCRFLNCRHMDEPGCAVKKLVEAGKISDMRYEFYRKVFQKLSRTRWNKHEK
ncbi:MAG: ribosome small subunit-dependent GTPase A [Fusobacteriaceae bacterium]|nr:ribosome small subunit-dependent GTPase A [Fusobacteriaceae bacterium]